MRLQLFVLAYNLASFLRRLTLPRSIRHWSLTTLREKLVKIGAKVVRHSRYVIFQLAEEVLTSRCLKRRLTLRRDESPSRGCIWAIPDRSSIHMQARQQRTTEWMIKGLLDPKT